MLKSDNKDVEGHIMQVLPDLTAPWRDREGDAKGGRRKRYLL